MTVLTATFWSGPAPRPGQYLKAARGRTAYEITAVRPLRSGLGNRRYRLNVVRHAPADVPAGATLILWTWNARRRRR